MHILITNDDGIDAEGIEILESIARHFSNEVTIVAPATNQSGTGRSISLHRDIEFHQRDPAHYSVDGTPADCVMLALNLLFTDKYPDLVLSGINHGMNVADDIGYSGTVGGAMEAAIVGLPPMALSQRFFKGMPDFSAVRNTGIQVLEHALKLSLCERTILNINFPAARAGGIKGVRRAQLDKHKFSDEILPGDVPGSYRIGPLMMRDQVEENTDRWWLDKGYVTFTPLMMDPTDRNMIDKIAEFDFDD